MPFKRLSLAILAAAASQMALASPATSTLQFQGAVKSTTCSISVDGVETPNPATVILQPVEATALNIKSGHQNMIEGGRFKIDLKNCSGSATQVSASFKGANGTTTYNGELENMATSNPAENVQLKLVHHHTPGGWNMVDVNGQTGWPLEYIDIGEGELSYGVHYTNGGGRRTVTGGNVEAAAEFTVLYQ